MCLNIFLLFFFISFSRSFYRAVMAVQQRAFEDAQKHINHARMLLDSELVSRMNESYDRYVCVHVRVCMYV